MNEKTFKGIGVSPGIVIGRAYLLDRRKVVIAEELRTGDVSAKDEVARFKKAVDQSKAQLDDVRKRVTKDLGKSHRYILDTHIMLLEDKMLVDGTVKRIKEEKLRSESALSETVAVIVQKFDAMEDEYLRERKHDVLQVVERVFKNLNGHGVGVDLPEGDWDGDLILVAHDLSPADMVLFKDSPFAAFVTDVGGATSHTAILGRSLDMPSVIALHNARALIREEEWVIVDGEQGKRAKDLLNIIATYRKAEDLINIGAYVAGSNPEIDYAIKMIDRVNAYLRQDMNERVSFEESRRQLLDLFH